MASSREEEYLDSLLNGFLNEQQKEDTEHIDDTVPKQEDLDDNSDMAVLNGLISKDANKYQGDDFSTYEPEDDISLDDLINAAKKDQNQERNEVNFEYKNEDDSADEDSSDDDNGFFSNLDEIIGNNDLPEEPDSGNASDDFVFQESKDEEEDDEVRDILALEEGMSVEDVPDEGQKLSEEELKRVESIANGENDDLDVSGNGQAEATLEDTNSSDNEAAGPKGKKSKKNKKAKKEKKNKKKFSLKDFFMNPDYEESEDGESHKDENQEILDEFYKDEATKADVSPEKKKKPAKEKKKKDKDKKKKKDKKPKKEKKKKAEKAERPVVNEPKVKIASIIKAVLFAGIISAAIILSCRYFSTLIAVNNAQKYYDNGQYELAYDSLCGLELKGKNADLYNQVRIMRSIEIGMDSYENYLALDKKNLALDALVRSVGRANAYSVDIEKYGIESKTDVIHKKITGILAEYGISEKDALELFAMTDYDKYSARLQEYINNYGLTAEENN